MHKNKPFISILTPTFNRSEFLPVLFQSLEQQNFQDFEWIVANDGSSDNTNELIESLMPSSNFQITYINSSHRVGKSKMDNLLLDHAKGKYLCWCDSDDYFTKNAFEIIREKLTALEMQNDYDDYIGLFAINKNTDAGLETFFRKDILEEGHYLWKEFENEVSGDGAIIANANLFEGKRFPEIDFLTIESVLLRDLYHEKKIVFMHDVLKIMDRTAENSISHGNKMQYCRGSSYSIAHTVTEGRFKKLNLKSKVKTIMTYIRYSIHGDIRLIDQIKNWQVARSNIGFFLIILPLSYLLTLRDLLLNKVEKTHLEFNQNIIKAEISHHSNNFKN